MRNLPSIELEIRRDINPTYLHALSEAEAGSIDGLMLNHGYQDVRGCSVEDALSAISEEAELLERIEVGDCDPSIVFAVQDEVYETGSDLADFDLGVGAAVIALSATGATPITSCNGGLLGDREHASDVPHILFSIDPIRLGIVTRAAEVSECGLINNAGHVELYANSLRAIHDFAVKLVFELHARDD